MATVKAAGDYKLEIGTGKKVSQFKLDISKLDKPAATIPSHVLDGRDQYIDVTTLSTRVNYSRGRNNPNEQFAPGQISFNLNDDKTSPAGQLSPFQTDSPYYNDVVGVPGLAPLRPLRLSRETEYMFVGRVNNYTPNYTHGELDMVYVSGADNLTMLARTYLPAITTIIQTTDQRLTTILDHANVNYEGLRNIEASTLTLGAYPIAADTNTAEYVEQIRQAERGRIFISRNGTLTSQKRTGATLTTPTINFTDRGDGYKYISIDVDTNAETIVNQVKINRVGGTQQTVENAASRNQYYTRTKTENNNLLETDAQTLALANYLLSPQAKPYFNAVTTEYGRLTNTQRTALTKLEIGDTISITKTLKSGDIFTQLLAVEGLEGAIIFEDGHALKIYTLPTVLKTYLKLDVPVYRKLDNNNVLR